MFSEATCVLAPRGLVSSSIDWFFRLWEGAIDPRSYLGNGKKQRSDEKGARREKETTPRTASCDAIDPAFSAFAGINICLRGSERDATRLIQSARVRWR
jgi:hypothetical protein